jgi:hypothetical protein
MAQPRAAHALRKHRKYRRTGIVETALCLKDGLSFKGEQGAQSKRAGFASGMHFDMVDLSPSEPIVGVAPQVY